jgi:hypothetical protein
VLESDLDLPTATVGFAHGWLVHVSNQSPRYLSGQVTNKTQGVSVHPLFLGMRRDDTKIREKE